MNALVRVSTVVVRAWTGFYTFGLHPTVRRERIDLVISDLHEELADLETKGGSPHRAALSLLSRCLRGALADLAWRAFDAGRDVPAVAVLDGPRRSAMASRKAKTQLFLIGSVLAWTTVAVLAVESPSNSLAWAGALLGLIAVSAWAMDAAHGAEDAAPGPWPLLLAAGITATAGGIVFEGGRIGLILAVPVAAGVSIAFLRGLHDGRAERTPSSLAPLPSQDLAARVQEGAAIAIERRQGSGGFTR